MNKIINALLNVQSEIRGVAKNKENKFLDYSYMDINAILKHILPILQKHKIFLHQSFETDEHNNFVCHTILLHESGESIKNEVPMRVVKEDPQSMGSLCTYSRRYGLVAFLGLQAVDDDGHSAMEWRTEEQKEEYQKLLSHSFFKGKHNETNNWFKDFKTKDETERALAVMRQKISEQMEEV